MKALKLIIEKSEGEYFGRVENPDFMPVSSAKSLDDLKTDIKNQIKDHLEYDEADSWSGTDINNMNFELCYDLTALFNRFDYLKITNVAEKAGMNSALLRQYVSGVKYPSADQSNKIVKAIREISKELAEAVVM